MFTLRIEHNIDKIVEDIKALEEKLQNLRDFWNLYSLPYLLDEVEEVFENEGPGWAPLSYPYVVEKAIDFPGQPKLRMTDLLFYSLTQLGAPYSVQQANPDRFIFGSDVPYAHWQEFGGFPPENWGPIPARPVIGNLPGDLDDRIGERLELYLDDLVENFDQGSLGFI